MKSSITRCCSSTFSCDIAYSESPAASRARPVAEVGEVGYPFVLESSHNRGWGSLGLDSTSSLPMAFDGAQPKHPVVALRSRMSGQLDLPGVEVLQGGPRTSPSHRRHRRSFPLQCRKPVLESDSGVHEPKNALLCRAAVFIASMAARITSTFSCDMAYSRSPAASRACARSRWEQRPPQSSTLRVDRLRSGRRRGALRTDR